MIKIDLHRAQAVIRAQQVLTVGLVGVPVRFSFGEKWKCLAKTVVFRQGDVTVDVLLPGNLAVMPWEVLQQEGVPVQIGVYGVNGDGKVVIPTVWAVTEPVRPSADPNAGSNLEPASPVWQQVLEQLGSLDRLDTKDKQTLVQAINEANRAVHLVTVTGDGNYTLENGGRELVEALEAGKVPVCHWEQRDMYLPLTHRGDDSDVIFSAVLDGVEYFVNIDTTKNLVRQCSTNRINEIYIGHEPPKDQDITLWIDPEEDAPVPYVPAPVKAEVGQTMVVQSVDEDGRPTAWGPADMDNGENTVYVTVTRQGEDYVSDRSYDELISALEQGLDVCCRHSWYRLPLVSRTVSELWFCGIIDNASVRVKFTRNSSGYGITVNKSDLISAPDRASAGQVLGVKSVDSTGRPIQWEPVDLPSGGGGATRGDTLKFIKSIKLTEEVSTVQINTDADGNPLNLKRIVVAISTFGGTANENKSSYMFYPGSVAAGAITKTVSSGIYASGAKVASVIDITMIKSGDYLFSSACNGTPNLTWCSYGSNETITELNIRAVTDGYTFGVNTIFNVMGVEA